MLLRCPSSARAGPFIRTTGYVSSDLGLHPFIVAFLAGPLASHAPGIASSVRLAASQQPQSVSVALSQVLQITMPTWPRQL